MVKIEDSAYNQGKQWLKPLNVRSRTNGANVRIYPQQKGSNPQSRGLIHSYPEVIHKNLLDLVKMQKYRLLLLRLRGAVETLDHLIMTIYQTMESYDKISLIHWTINESIS